MAGEPARRAAGRCWLLTPDDEQLALHDGPDLLRWEAHALRMTMRRELNVADPVPGVTELEELAATLELAAGTAGEERRRTLSRAGHVENLALLAVLIQDADSATLKRQRADERLRLEAASLKEAGEARLTAR